MSNYWDLFAETGDIGFYLLYLESTEENALPEVNEPPTQETITSC
jgi:hypothetical protein